MASGKKITINKDMTVRKLAEVIELSPRDVIKLLVQKGIVRGINQIVEKQIACELAIDLGFELDNDPSVQQSPKAQHTDLLLDRFSHQAVAVLVHAQDEASRLGQDDIGTEFLLVGLMMEEHGLAAKALSSSGILTKDLKIEVEKVIGRGSGFQKQVSFTPRAAKILQRASLKAKECGDYCVETEHLLLCLLEETEGHGIRVLENLGKQRDLLVDLINKIREENLLNLKNAFPLALKQGDVVLVGIDESDETGRTKTKRRPAVVISSGDCIARSTHIVVVPVVADHRDRPRDFLDIPIGASSVAGKSANFRQDCIVACTHVYSIPRNSLVGKTGSLPKENIIEICKSVWSLINPN